MGEAPFYPVVDLCRSPMQWPTFLAELEIRLMHETARDNKPPPDGISPPHQCTLVSLTSGIVGTMSYPFKGYIVLPHPPVSLLPWGPKMLRLCAFLKDCNQHPLQVYRHEMQCYLAPLTLPILWDLMEKGAVVFYADKDYLLMTHNNFSYL